MRTGKRLLIVGAGPKALAIAAKAAALDRSGYSVPDITIIERDRVAAHWSGGFGYTDGRPTLGTAPEKDIGFPYASQLFDRKVDLDLLNNYSWQAYNIKKWSAHPDALQSYGEDVDRGIAGHPIHSQWSDYLKWVGQHLIPATTTLFEGEVVGVRADQAQWEVSVLKNGTSMTIRGDGIVITGPGPARAVLGQPANHPRVFDGRTLWQHIADFENVPWDEEPIGIIGSGETAASVIVALARILRNPVPIVVVNRQGAIFSRGEGYWENHLFTDPEDWTLLSLEERTEIIRRTDRGVFSLGAMTFINQLRNVIHKRMENATIEIARDHELEDEGRPVLVDGSKVRLPVLYAIVATGFDPWWFVKSFSDLALRAVMAHPDQREVLLWNIEPDLAFSHDRVPTPKLHVPMLAGLAQGPGFPNLSCLGHLADRILSSYVPELTASHRA